MASSSNIFAYFLGSLGLIQAVFLPGYCITSRLRDWNWQQKLVFAIPLSLIFNHFLVWSLVFLGIYGQETMLAVLVLEGTWLCLRARRITHAESSQSPVDRPTEVLLFCAAISAITKYAEAWGRGFGETFQMWDALVSWNSWARSWFDNHVSFSGMYPGGLSESYSIPYALMGRTDLEAFSKASSGMLFLGALLALLELGFRRKDLRLLSWATVFLYPNLQAKFLHSHWISGYADVPLTAMTIFAFSASFLAGPEMPWVYGALAGGVPLVKQPGLLFAALSPLLVRRCWQGWRETRLLWIKILVTTAAVAGPWCLYIFTWIYILHRDTNNMMGLAHMVPGGFFTRWSATLRLLVAYSSVPYLIGWSMAALTGGIVSKVARRWLFLFGLPYFFIWGTFFSYDERNLSMALFPIAMSAAATLVWLLDATEVRCFRFLPRWRIPAKKLALLSFLSPLLFIAIGLNKPFHHWREEGSPLAWERRQRLDIGDLPRANRATEALLPCRATTHAVFLSNYGWILTIPELDGAVRRLSCKKIAEGIRRKFRAYALVDIGGCDSESQKQIVALPALYKEGPVSLLALDPSLPKSCNQPAL